MHVFEDGSVISILEIYPYSALGCASIYKLFRGRGFDCAAGDAGNEPGTEKDRENAEVLGGMRHRNACVAYAKGILEAGAEVIREGHRSGCDEVDEFES
jgi:hypothetical protein